MVPVTEGERHLEREIDKLEDMLTRRDERLTALIEDNERLSRRLRDVRFNNVALMEVNDHLRDGLAVWECWSQEPIKEREVPT